MILGMEKPLAAMFDFDGVIINGDNFYRTTVERSFKHYGIPFNETTFHNQFAGKPGREAMGKYLRRLGKEAQLPDIWDHKRQFDGEYGQLISAYPDALELITLIADSQKVIVTGSRLTLVQQALDKFGIRKHFPTIVSVEDYRNGKPAPDSYLLAQNRLAVLPGESVIVEDSPAGIQAARAAGIPVIAVTHTHKAEELIGANYITDSLTDPLVIEIFRGKEKLSS